MCIERLLTCALDCIKSNITWTPESKEFPFLLQMIKPRPKGKQFRGVGRGIPLWKEGVAELVASSGP